MNKTLIYLDNAATTFPKPPSVIRAAHECMEKYCGNPARGSNPLAMKSAEAIYNCRQALSDMFNCRPENVILTYNTTYALNMAIKGATKHGGHVLISNMEHNAVLRPVASLQRDGQIEYDTFCTYGLSDSEIIADIDRKKRPDTCAICCLHMSNICPYTLPIQKIGRYCHENGLLFICDGAQSAGHIDINMRQSDIDILCIPFHKGLYGIQGGGAMLLGDNVRLETLIEGGNGVNSLDFFMGEYVPERYEAGTLNTPAAVALTEGIKCLQAKGLDTLIRHERGLYDMTLSLLSDINGIHLYGIEDTSKAHKANTSTGSVVLFNIDGIPSDEVGELLGKEGICVRTGFHCSPLAHKTLGTPSHGAVRVSLGMFNTPAHISALASAVEKIASKKAR